jgi:peptidyl-dipeptidase Dcp
LIITFLSSTNDSPQTKNPFLSEYLTPFEAPPFDKIEEKHYLSAFTEGIKQQQKEIETIVESSESPTFENTIEALEESGSLLQKVSNIFYHMISANTNDDIQSIAKEVLPLLAKNRDDIRLNEKLFQRVKKVFDQRSCINLSAEQNKLLEETHKYFIRGGANLSPSEKEIFRKINRELSLLSLHFSENVLKENNRFELIIDNSQDLAGLPENVISAAADTAKERHQPGKWIFTLHKPSLIPFLQYSEKRDLREKILKGYINRGNNNDDLDNKKILEKIVCLRIQRAKLLGYHNHAEYVLEENMVKNPENVLKFLNQVWVPALKVAKKEAKALQKMIYNEGNNFKLQPWDWWYYAEKLKKMKYDIDEEQLRPYFKLENVRDGAFYVATKLFGITFTPRQDLPVYHPDVKVFEVKESDGRHIGLLYTDYFPRPSKKGGAWMNALRKQHRINGKNITPLIVNVGNLSKPTGDTPALLSWEEVTTLFHEFGHALHGLLSNRTYHSLSGTAVPPDFVELPSQILENWAAEPDVLQHFAKHYLTGESIPDNLIIKMQNSHCFNQGFHTVEYLAAAFLDMEWHTLGESSEISPINFEENALDKIGLIPEIIVRYRSPHFQHIFSGGYSAGYYSYIWSEMLDADAFQFFKEKGIFDQKTANSFRENILAAGGTEDPMKLYRRFRGSEPKVETLLKRKGIK